MRRGIGVLCGVISMALAAPAWAQEDMDWSEEEPVDPDAVDEADDGGGGDEMDWTEGGDEGDVGDVGDVGGEGDVGDGGDVGGDDDLFGEIGGTEDTQVEAPQSEGPQRELEDPEVWAVQRVYALRYRRFEIVPRFGFSMNDQFVSHFAFGGQMNWYITDVLAIGLEGQWFFLNPESDTNFYTARSFRVTVPINEYWMGWYLNFSYVPMYGKFALFNRWIVHWDVFISGGLGVTLTRPIAVVDSEFRNFEDTSDWNPNITFSIGIGGRTFLTRWLAIFAELRMYGFPQALEEQSISPLSDPCPQGEASCPGNWDDQRANPDNWLDEDGEFAVNVMAQIGLSFFLPPTFDYNLPL